MPIRCLNVVLLLLTLVASLTLSQANDAPRPNIILIMSDDMGYSDLGCYGGEIPTPHIDALAMDGLAYQRGDPCPRSEQVNKYC